MPGAHGKMAAIGRPVERVSRLVESTGYGASFATFVIWYSINLCYLFQK